MIKELCLLMLLFVSVLSGAEKVSNPVSPVGHDPWIVLHDGVYYYCYSSGGRIKVNSSADMIEALQFRGKTVWRPERGKEYSQSLWAPELHYVQGRWYIYVAADDGRNENHRMFVLAAKSDDACGEYEFKGKISDKSDKWAIDGTVMEYAGGLYFIWSGWEGDEDVRQDLYIAPMSDPLTISGERVCISKPEYDWEKVGNPLVNEGPQILRSPAGDVFIIYSASGSWSDSYCLGQLRLIGADPLKAESWVKKDKPVFAGTDKVFSPGHASFTRSQDGKEDWIVYHTARAKGSGWRRDCNIKRFGWSETGEPVFGEPLDKGVLFPGPAGGDIVPEQPVK